MQGHRGTRATEKDRWLGELSLLAKEMNCQVEWLGHNVVPKGRNSADVMTMLVERKQLGSRFHLVPG